MSNTPGPSRSRRRALLEFTRETALSAGKLLKRGFGSTKKVRYKGRTDPVTEWDVRAERHIIDCITRTYAEHSVLAEEGGQSSGDSGYRWVIDPLDGTVNYAHGFPFYCVSIGLQYNGGPLIGAVYDPERDELFSAAAGMGASLNSARLAVSTEPDLGRAMLATGFAYDVATARRNNIGYFGRMVKTAQAVRRPGSAALDLCWLAAGRIDGFWELHLHPWDTAAAALIVTEAGGRVSRFDGREYSIFDKEILASNGPLHGQMQRVLGAGN